MADRKLRPEIEILSAEDVPRRRNWNEADKIRIAEESFVGHRQVSATARRRGAPRSLLTTRWPEYRACDLVDDLAPAFFPLTLAPMAPAVSAVAATSVTRPNARVEIILTNGRRLSVPGDLAPAPLAGLLAAVDRYDRVPVAVKVRIAGGVTGMRRGMEFGSRCWR